MLPDRVSNPGPLTYESGALSIETDTCRFEQTPKTQIRLLLVEQSDQGLNCLPCFMHILD